MTDNHLWLQSKNLQIQTGPDIVGGFDIGFDPMIPEETIDKLMDFTYWVEDHFSIPVTLWVNFKYKQYLLNQERKRVAFQFYCVPFTTFPVFDNWDDLPVIELAVNRPMEEILPAFIEAITCYFSWLTNVFEEISIDDILQDYLNK